MSDVVVARHGEGWTVRHPRRLHEHFQRRSDALRKAAGYARQLSRDGGSCGVREQPARLGAGADRAARRPPAGA